MTTDTLQARWLHWKKLPFPPEADITVKLHSDEEEEVAVKELVTAMSDNIEVCLRDPSADTGYKVELEWDIERLNACSAQLPLATKQYTQELNAIARAIV